jgi:hypothetical protein
VTFTDAFLGRHSVVDGLGAVKGDAGELAPLRDIAGSGAQQAEVSQVEFLARPVAKLLTQSQRLATATLADAGPLHAVPVVLPRTGSTRSSSPPMFVGIGEWTVAPCINGSSTSDAMAGCAIWAGMDEAVYPLGAVVSVGGTRRQVHQGARERRATVAGWTRTRCSSNACTLRCGQWQVLTCVPSADRR